MTVDIKIILFILCATSSVDGPNSSNYELPPIKCKAEIVMSVQNASITCFFGLDISNTTEDIEVMRYPFQGDSDEAKAGEDVLRCPRKIADLDCIVKKGYDFDNNVTHILTVTIRNYTKQFEGIYACGLVGQTDGGIRKRDKCILSVNEDKPTGRELGLAKSTDSNCNYCKCQQKPCGESGSTNATVCLSIAIVVLGVALILSILLNAYVIIDKRSPTYRWCTSRFQGTSRESHRAPSEEAEQNEWIEVKKDDVEPAQDSASVNSDRSEGDL